MMINEIMALLVAEMQADEVIDPLAQRFTLAGVWADLARLAGETIPAEVAIIVGATLDQAIDPLPIPVRGAYADYTRVPVYAD